MRVRGVEAQRRGRARAGQRGEVRASRVTHALTSKRARRRNGRQGAGEVEEGRQRGHLRFVRGGTVSGREGRLRNVPERIIGRGARGSRRRSRRARARARGVRDKNFRRESDAGEGNAWRTWSIVLSPLAFRGLSGVNIPGGSWVLSMSRSAGRVAARCAFTRARGAAFRTKAGGAKCDPEPRWRKKRETSSPSPAVRWRGVRDCARRAQAGYRTSA